MQPTSERKRLRLTLNMSLLSPQNAVCENVRGFDSANLPDGIVQERFHDGKFMSQ